MPFEVNQFASSQQLPEEVAAVHVVRITLRQAAEKALNGVNIQQATLFVHELIEDCLNLCQEFILYIKDQFSQRIDELLFNVPLMTSARAAVQATREFYGSEDARCLLNWAIREFRDLLNPPGQQVRSQLPLNPVWNPLLDNFQN